MTVVTRRQLVKLTGAALSSLNRTFTYLSTGIAGAFTASACSPLNLAGNKSKPTNMPTGTGSLFQNPIVKLLSSNATFMSGCTATFYLTGTTQLTPIYADGNLATPLANPLSADASGTFPAIYLDPAVAYRVQIKTSTGILISDTDPYLPALSQSGLTTGLVGNLLYPRSRAEVTAGVFPTNLQYPVGNVLRYGATGDGATDDSSAFQAAFSIAGVRVRIPASSTPYLCNSNLGVPLCGSVAGDGWNQSIIHCGVSVTKLISVTGACATLYEDFQITGNTTNHAIGIVVGDGALTSQIVFYNLMISGFTGRGGVGLELDQIVTLHAFNCTFQASNNNVVTGTTASLPTTVHFWGGWIQTAASVGGNGGEGVVIQSGDTVCFHGVVFQSNAKNAILVKTASGCTVADLLIDANCWLEDNWHKHTDTGTQVFAVVIDGTSGRDAAKTSAIIKDTRFSHATSAASDRRSLQVTHAFAALDNMRCLYGFPFEIVVTTSDCFVTCMGNGSDRMTRFISNPTGAAVRAPVMGQVIDLGTGQSLLPGTWQSWTPTYSSNVGNAAATFSGGAVTTTLAEYVVLGKQCTVTVQFNATLNAVTPNQLNVSLPTGIKAANASTIQPCLTSDGGTGFIGVIETQGSNVLKMIRDPALNTWGSGHTCSGALSFTFRIQ